MFNLAYEKDTDDFDAKYKQQSLSTNSVPSRQQILYGEDDQMEIVGFRFNKLKNYLTWFLYVLSGGLVRLFFHWYPQIKLYATHTECDLEVAERVMIIDIYKSKFKSYYVEAVHSKTATLYSEGETQNYNGDIIILRSTTEKKKKKLTLYLENGKTLELSSVRTINFKKMLYAWNPEEKQFFRLIGLDFGKKKAEFHSYQGMNEMEQSLRRIIYGRNEINIPVQSIFKLFVLEASTPFYVFQVFSVLLWIAEYYFYYGIAIVMMSAYGISSSIIQTRTNQRNLKGTVFSEDTVTVMRGENVLEQTKTSNLVPGDVITIPSRGCNMQCDAVLLKGTCIVNESMLTGESIPVHKTPLPNDSTFYHVKEDSNHTLFCGTTVLQTKFSSDTDTLAVVIRTGFLTTKGELVRSILYPPPADFRFDQDSYKFIGILCVIAMSGFIYTIITKFSRQLPLLDIIIKALDLITIAIPPALPAAMTVGKLYALDRLRKKNIYCINSRVINVSGSIDCVCFDKTGTLTEDELDMWGVIPVIDGKMDAPVKKIKSMTTDIPLYKGMLTCHSLSIINGKVCGYPLDLKMFESTSWHLQEPANDDVYGKNLIPETVVHPKQSSEYTDRSIGIYVQFPFVSALQRSSVICRNCKKGSKFEVYCKGSPEMIVALSKKETVPDNIFDKLKFFTTKGYRVIAIANKQLDIQEDEVLKITRNQIENELSFLGLIILENRLKSQTPGIIKLLKDAELKIKMITGDNIQTAVSVGKECGIIEESSSIIEVIATYSPKLGPNIRFCSYDEDLTDFEYSITDQISSKFQDPEISCHRYQFVLTGASWSNIVEYFPDVVHGIATRGVVFSRMSAHQKQQLIEILKNMRYYVAMCGDGANDCAALKAAHLGISLSDAETSIAAPFTSKEPNISCVPNIIREGRAALLTSFGVFEFMICSSLTEFFCTIILYSIDCNLSSMQFFFVDIFLQWNFASFFGNAAACDQLYREPPLTSLLSFVPLMSMTLFMLQAVSFQLFAFYFTRSFDWYKPFAYKPHMADVSKCQENYFTFVITMFQYITMAIMFSKGKPYRQPIYTNKIFTILLILLTLVCSYITLYSPNWMLQIFEMNIAPEMDARWEVLFIAFLNFLLALFIESFLVNMMLVKMIVPRFKNYRKSKHINDINLVKANVKNDETMVVRKENERSNGLS